MDELTRKYGALDADPERVGREWLDQVRGLKPPGLRDEPAAPSGALATVPAEFGLAEIDAFLGTGEGVSHPAPLSPPSAPGRTGAGAAAPPPAADPRGIRPVRDDLYRLHHAIVQSDSAAAAAMVDIDWSAIEALVRILDVPPPSP